MDTYLTPIILVAVEASLLALITRNLLSIFRCDQTLAVESGQAAADQIRILSKGTRGSELLAIMYSDPYSRMLELIEEREFELIDQKGELGGYGVVLGSCRQILEDLFKIRADRLSDESLALPPTHFFIMTILTMLILLGYAIVSFPLKFYSVAPFASFTTHLVSLKHFFPSLTPCYKIKIIECAPYCRRCIRNTLERKRYSLCHSHFSICTILQFRGRLE